LSLRGSLLALGLTDLMCSVRASAKAARIADFETSAPGGLRRQDIAEGSEVQRGRLVI
jgi:hypothetical protein